ncbi:MAG: glycosyltransferase family 4 protein, partial [Chthoniobacterales bacterium]|nr:glycosyltransferase family 4 protein [Chthoniobacterales bacterium]
ASVIFLGPQFGEAKASCYRHCDAFVLPSFSEGLPMVVLEAWAYAKPVLMTPECNLPEGFAAQAALRVGTTVEDIKEELEALFAAPEVALTEIGKRGRELVENRFAWKRIAAQVKITYEWMLGGGSKPGCFFEG